MRNITVTVDEETYRRASQAAAVRETSVTAMVTEFLSQLGTEDTEFERLKRLEWEVREQIGEFRAGDRLTRDELHERSR